MEGLKPGSSFYIANIFEVKKKAELKLAVRLAQLVVKISGSLEECDQSFEMLYLLNTVYFCAFKSLERKQEAVIFLRDLTRHHLNHRQTIPMFATQAEELQPFSECMLECELYRSKIIVETGLVNDALALLTEPVLDEIKRR